MTLPMRAEDALDQDLAAAIRDVRLMVFDFDGVFTDNTVYVFEDGREAVRCWRGDGLGLSRIKDLGIDCMILSTEVNPVVTARAKKLGLPCVQGQPDKAAALKDILAEKSLAPDQVAYVGNDINDTGCLELAGLPMVVADAHADVLALGRYRTVAVGGHGAVREICDLFAGVLDADQTEKAETPQP